MMQQKKEWVHHLLKQQYLREPLQSLLNFLLPVVTVRFGGFHGFRGSTLNDIVDGIFLVAIRESIFKVATKS